MGKKLPSRRAQFAAKKSTKVIAKNGRNPRVAIEDQMIALADLMIALQNKTGIAISQYEVTVPSLMQLRNNELFPFLQQKAVVAGGAILLSFANAVKVMELLSQIIPELNFEMNISTQDYIKRYLKTLTVWHSPKFPIRPCGEGQPQQILIRKEDFRIYKYEGRHKLHVVQAQQNEGLFIDPLDAEYLFLKHEAGTN